MKITNKLAAALAYLIEEEHLSPYCAFMRLKEQGWENLPCPRTIYNHLEYGDLHIDRTKLPYKPRGQKCKPKAPPRRAWKNPGNISIEERPESVATREEFGHWEMDTIVSCVGGRGGVLILVERQTRFAVTAKLDRLTKHDVLQALKKVRGKMKTIRSVTTDWLNSLHRQKLNDISPKQAFFPRRLKIAAICNRWRLAFGIYIWYKRKRRAAQGREFYPEARGNQEFL